MRRLRQAQRRIELTMEVLWAYVLVRAAMARWDARTAVAWLRTTSHRRWTATATVPDYRLAEATVRVLSRLPTDSRCLMRSLVLIRVLASRGIDTTLVIGVRPGETLAAHAWVQRDARQLLGSDAEGFDRLLEL